MLKLVLLVVACFAIFTLAAALLRHRGGAGAIGLPYRLATPLFSPAERSFLGVLDVAVGPGHRVFGKVRVADLAQPKPGLGASARQAALNRVASKHFDFVVCRADDLGVVCAVELNDRSHASRRAQARDALLAQVCATIGLPLLVLEARQAYQPQEIARQFAAVVAAGQQRSEDLPKSLA